MSFLAAIGAAIASISLTEVIVGAIIATALSVLAQIIMMPSRKGQRDPFKPTQYTRREVGGTTPVVVGRRLTYGIEVFRKNDSTYPGASSRQFYFVVYSVGPIGFISNTRVFNERDIFALGHSGAHSALIDFRYGTLDQAPTGFGWSDIGGDPSRAKNKYDALGLMVTPNAPHPLAYVGRAGLNIFLAADEQGRSQGANIAVDSIVDGLTCRRFKNTDGDYVCHVGGHNQWVEYWYNKKRYAAQVEAGTYTASELAAAVQTALNAAEDDDGQATPITFTVSTSQTTNAYSGETETRFTIEAATADVRLLTWTGSHRGADIWDDLGFLRGARYSFDPTKSGGNEFDDLRLAGTGPYSITSFHPFERVFTRNPIRICYELRTNPDVSPGIERPDDFDQALMLAEEQYCNEIVTVDGVTQYDVQPRNVLPMLKRVYGADGLISGTTGNPSSLLYLIDGEYANAAPIHPFSKESIQTTYVPQILFRFYPSYYKIDKIVIKTNNTVAQSYKLQYTNAKPDRLCFFSYAWSDYLFTDIPGGTITDSTEPVKTIEFDAIYVTGIRIVGFSAKSGPFSLCEVEVYTTKGRRVVHKNLISLLRTEIAININVIGNVNFLSDGGTNKDVIFDTMPGGSGTSGPYYEIRFPFKRRIGLIVLATNVGEPQSYKIYYQASTDGDWTLLAERADIKGTDYVFVPPTEMISFRITDMSRSGGTAPFSLTEIEAYDAIPSRRYTLDAINENGEKFKDFLLRLYESFFAIPCNQFGRKWIRVERDEPPVQEINEDHVVTYQKKRFPRREKVNQWLCRYANEIQNYETDVVVMDDYASQLRQHRYPGGGTGEVISSREVEFYGVTRPMQMLRMGNILRNRARYADRVHYLECRPGTVSAVIGDVIRLNLPSYRVRNQLVRILRVVERGDFATELECVDHFADVYADTAISLGDIQFQRDAVAGGTNGLPGVLPADVQNVIASASKIETDGVSAPWVSVTFSAPEDPNYSHADFWVNYNDEIDESGERVYKHVSSQMQGDGAYAFPVDTTGAVDGVWTARVLVQAVSKTGTRKSITQIDAEYENGQNTAIGTVLVLLDDTQEFYSAYLAHSAWASQQAYITEQFIADGTTTQFTIAETYRPFTVVVEVDGYTLRPKLAGVTDGTEGSQDTWEFQELTETNQIEVFQYDAGQRDPLPEGSIILAHYIPYL